MIALSSPTPLVGIPTPAADRFAGAQRTADEAARRVVESHRRSLQHRRLRDLTAEKHLLWIDGEGDSQWADIFDGQRVAIPRLLNEFRVTENLLRPIVDNAVAYHCTKPLRFIAEARNDSLARQQAVVDAALVNYIAREQRINPLLAMAMYLAMPCGFCPVHATWRDDIGYDPYEPLYVKPEELGGINLPRKGKVDCWVGNPFDTTYNENARRGNISAIRYGRIFPAQQIRDTFGIEIEGTDKMPSASIFQRVARQWSNLFGLNQHGSATLGGGQAGEELIAVVCEEVAPGVEADFPDGRLTCVAIPGAAETRRDVHAGGYGGRAVHLVSQPLPAGRFSSVNVYSHQRYDDVLSKGWVADLAELQRDLNDVLSDRKQWSKRMVNAPTMYSGELTDDQREYDGYTLLEIGGGATFTPQVLTMPGGVVTELANRAQEIRQAMYTIGGYQSASRGEGNSGDPFAKVAFLAEQDDTIHGPTNQAFRHTCEDFAKLWWALFRDNADVGWLIDAVGDEFDMLGDAYVDRTRVSPSPPQFKVVSGFGATSELKGRQLMTLVQMRGSDGQPVMTTDEMRRQWPDGSMFDPRSDPTASQKRRARMVVAKMRILAQQAREQNDIQATDYSDPMVQQAGLWLANAAHQQFPPLPTDDATANLAALSEAAQDETEDAIARVAYGHRWQQYQMWQQQIQMQQAQQQAGIAAVGQPQQQIGPGGANKKVPQEDPAALAESAGVQQPQMQEQEMVA
jgi:hypothetical protein